MTLSQFMTTIRFALKPLSLSAVLGAAGLLMGAQSVPTDGPLVTNVGHFQIPFDVETEPGEKAEGFAVLFGSRDGGARWEQIQSVPASQSSFMFAAPRDGRYSFCIRMTDAQGNVSPPAQNSVAELDVIVDTITPDLKLELFESAPGQVLVNWTCTDSSVAPESMVLEYADGANGRWKAAQIQKSANGQSLIPASQGSVLAVRASIVDMAGNRTDAASQIVTRGGSTANSFHQPSQPTAQSVPLGLSPFNIVAANPIAPPSSPIQPGVAFPPASNTNFNAAVINSPLSNALAGSAMRPFGSTTEAAMSGPGEVQLVNMHVFDVDYQVEDVGPSGVSAIELFVTENGGQQWFRYGNDADLRSPFQVDAQGEGTFGFAVRVRNGLGFIDAPPQPGQSPEIMVTVDESAPVVQLAQPTIRTDGLGTLDLAWKISDQHPSSTPVRLEYATTPNGPWTPVFDWQADQGGYQWAIRPGTPASLYFRLLARDAAGNVASAQTPQAVIVDLKKPIGRLLRVQAASHSTTLR